jgi:hypothetical protein
MRDANTVETPSIILVTKQHKTKKKENYAEKCERPEFYPSVRSNFLWAWIVGLGLGKLAQGPDEWLCLGCIGFSYDFWRYGKNA